MDAGPVGVGGHADGGSGLGTSRVELHWRDGLIGRVAELRQFTSDDPVMQSPAGDGQDPIIVGDVAGHLSSWISITPLITWLTTLMLLIGEPLPWRAPGGPGSRSSRTHWAIGPLVFLLLSGPAISRPIGHDGDHDVWKGL